MRKKTAWFLFPESPDSPADTARKATEALGVTEYGARYTWSAQPALWILENDPRNPGAYDFARCLPGSRIQMVTSVEPGSVVIRVNERYRAFSERSSSACLADVLEAAACREDKEDVTLKPGDQCVWRGVKAAVDTVYDGEDGFAYCDINTSAGAPCVVRAAEVVKITKRS